MRHWRTKETHTNHKVVLKDIGKMTGLNYKLYIGYLTYNILAPVRKMHYCGRMFMGIYPRYPPLLVTNAGYYILGKNTNCTLTIDATQTAMPRLSQALSLIDITTLTYYLG